MEKCCEGSVVKECCGEVFAVKCWRDMLLGSVVEKCCEGVLERNVAGKCCREVLW